MLALRMNFSANPWAEGRPTREFIKRTALWIIFCGAKRKTSSRDWFELWSFRENKRLH